MGPHKNIIEALSDVTGSEGIVMELALCDLYKASSGKVIPTSACPRNMVNIPHGTNANELSLVCNSGASVCYCSVEEGMADRRVSRAQGHYRTLCRLSPLFLTICFRFRHPIPVIEQQIYSRQQ